MHFQTTTIMIKLTHLITKHCKSSGIVILRRSDYYKKIILMISYILSVLLVIYYGIKLSYMELNYLLNHKLYLNKVNKFIERLRWIFFDHHD